RRTFVCLGDAVNLAARLMSKASPGHIIASDRVQAAAGDGFTWERLPEFTVKGKQDTVVAYELENARRRGAQRHLRHRLSMVGRDDEMALLGRQLEEALGGSGGVVGIAADAGMGKSRLVAEFVRGVRRRGHIVAFGECQPFGRNTSYFAWREIWRTLFHLRD